MTEVYAHTKNQDNTALSRLRYCKLVILVLYAWTNYQLMENSDV